MATAAKVEAAPEVKCPKGWHHEHDPETCEVDKQVHRWLSRRKETTLAEREQKRAELHMRHGHFMPDDEDEG